MEKEFIDKIIKYALSDDTNKDRIYRKSAKNVLNTLYKAAIVNEADELFNKTIESAISDNCFNIEAIVDLLNYINIKEDVQKYGKDAVKSVITLLHNKIIDYYNNIINNQIKDTEDLYKQLSEVDSNINKDDIIKIIKELLE